MTDRIFVRPIKIMLDTNIPNKSLIPFTKSMLYNPILKNMDSLHEYPYFTQDTIFPNFLYQMTYEEQVQFFFNKEEMMKIMMKYSNIQRIDGSDQNQITTQEEISKKSEEERKIEEYKKKRENYESNEKEIKRKLDIETENINKLKSSIETIKDKLNILKTVANNILKNNQITEIETTPEGNIQKIFKKQHIKMGSYLENEESVLNELYNNYDDEQTKNIINKVIEKIRKGITNLG